MQRIFRDWSRSSKLLFLRSQPRRKVQDMIIVRPEGYHQSFRLFNNIQCEKFIDNNWHTYRKTHNCLAPKSISRFSVVLIIRRLKTRRIPLLSIRSTDVIVYLS